MIGRFAIFVRSAMHMLSFKLLVSRAIQLCGLWDTFYAAGDRFYANADRLYARLHISFCYLATAQWKGLKRKQSTAFIGLGMFCPVQKWHVETWNSDCEPSREYKIVSRQNMGWRNTTQQQQGQAWRLRSVHQQLPTIGPGTADMPEAVSFLEGTWSCGVFSKAYNLSEKNSCQGFNWVKNVIASRSRQIQLLDSWSSSWRSHEAANSCKPFAYTTQLTNTEVGLLIVRSKFLWKWPLVVTEGFVWWLSGLRCLELDPGTCVVFHN